MTVPVLIEGMNAHVSYIGNLRLIRAGELHAVEYTFTEIGNKLAMHKHTEKTEHLTIVLKGEVTIKTSDFAGRFKAGDVIDYPVAEIPHEIEALTAGAKVLNITKYYNANPIEIVK